MPSSRGFSQTRARTQVSCTAGRFFVLWATREAQLLNVLNMSEYWWFSCSQRQNKAQMRVDHWLWIGCWDVKYEDFLEDNNSPWPVILFLFCQRRFLSYLDQENNCRSPLVLTCSAERKLLLLVVKRKKDMAQEASQGQQHSGQLAERKPGWRGREATQLVRCGGNKSHTIMRLAISDSCNFSPSNIRKWQ